MFFTFLSFNGIKSPCSDDDYDDGLFFQIFMMTMTMVDVFQDKNLTWNGIESPGDKNSKKRDFPLESFSPVGDENSS